MHAQRDTTRLLNYLHRGGAYAHLWTDAGNQSYWFTVNGQHREKRRKIPKGWLKENIYFSVHPLAQIPPHNASGNTNPRFIGSQLAYIAAVNALYAEYDGKDYVTSAEYAPYLPNNFSKLTQLHKNIAIRAAKESAFYKSPESYKRRVLSLIQALHYAPSVVVDSGGGYHCYWLFREMVPVDDTNLPDLQALQYGWVQMVQGDPGASDLRRVLRLPGSYNWKVEFGSRQPKVTFVKRDFSLQYSYTTLDEAVNDWLFAHRPKMATDPKKDSGTYGDNLHRHHSRDHGKDHNKYHKHVRKLFNQQHSLVDLLTKHGYRLSFANKTMTRLARPGRSKYRTSVTVFHPKEDGMPELSIHFSTNDALYSDEYIDPETGSVKRQAHDAYYAYVMLEHEGDWQMASRAAWQN